MEEVVERERLEQRQVQRREEAVAEGGEEELLCKVDFMARGGAMVLPCEQRVDEWSEDRVEEFDHNGGEEAAEDLAAPPGAGPPRDEQRSAEEQPELRAHGGRHECDEHGPREHEPPQPLPTAEDAHERQRHAIGHHLCIEGHKVVVRRVEADRVVGGHELFALGRGRLARRRGRVACSRVRPVAVVDRPLVAEAGLGARPVLQERRGPEHDEQAVEGLPDRLLPRVLGFVKHEEHEPERRRRPEPL